MTEKFNGFSHDEILKITGVKEGGVGKRAANLEAAKQALRNQPGIRRMPDKIFRQADQLRKQQQQQQQPTKKPDEVKKTKSGTVTPTEKPEIPTAEDDVVHESLNLDRALSDSLMEALYHGHATPRDNKPTPTATYADAAVEISEATSADDSSILKISGGDSQNTGSTYDASILPSSKDSTSQERLNTDSPFKGISLKDFEQHRRMIEEQNKQKKQLLYQAIEQHTQKTAAESRKIEEIRHELSKLESDLAVDVAMLRKQIDNACIHFSNVEKQYVKIEAQFLRAKIELHNASEKKELLTEHLCTVIAHNEDRKAEKLTELMQKVGLAPNDEPLPSPATRLSIEPN
ncbi:RAB6-interacting golgin [Drosophila rhopaloa]|uniref:RAB6-interacting golgin n=1 Tax=Drosophila rhopaloa TaxID=1041015 RepID=A0A6P4F724_DRORH|nr:RAB6-interacting golgin [Drosophila rhopaloa]